MPDDDVERMYEEMERQFFGKYRGSVVNTADPLGEGRLEVQVPAVSGNSDTYWAMPCVPYAAADLGWHALPPVGASVWVEYEGGNMQRPIWVGCFWDTGESPPETAPDVFMLKTPGATVKITDTGDVEIETSAGTKLTMSGTEILLKAPSIKQDADAGQTEVSAAGFNAQNGAFTVV